MFSHPCEHFTTVLNSISTVKSNKSNKKNLNHDVINRYITSKKTRHTPEPEIYIQLTGKRNKAKVLNQLIFWSNKSKCKDGWFYKKYEEWEKETGISDRTLRSIFNEFEKEGWITTKVKKVYGKNIKHFKIFLDKIMDSIESKLGLKPIHADKENNKNKAVQELPQPENLPVPYKENIDHLDKDMGIRSTSVSKTENKATQNFSNKNTNLETWEQYCNWQTTSTKPDYYYKHENNNQVEQKNRISSTEQFLEYAKKQKEQCLHDKECKELFDKRFSKYEITYEEILQQCYEYNLHQNKCVIYPNKLLGWIKTQCPKKQGYTKKYITAANEIILTDEERDLYGARIRELQSEHYKILTETDRKHADELIKKFKLRTPIQKKTMKLN